MTELRLVWRSPLRDDGQPFADWLRSLRRPGLAGVYLIRDARTHELHYVGESHRNRLYDTLTRHLQNWSGFGSGPTYDPRRVEVAIVLLDDPQAAPVLQFELIQQLNPSDNVQDGRWLFQHKRYALTERESGADDLASAFGGDRQPGEDDIAETFAVPDDAGEEVPF